MTMIQRGNKRHANHLGQPIQPGLAGGCMILQVSHDGRRFRIGETNVGIYVYVFERDQCTHDYLEDTLVLAKECARERFGVPENSWSEIPPAV